MENSAIKELIEAILSLKSKEVALNFMQNILTPAELDEIAARLQIVKMLNNGASQREVAKQLGVSIGSVSRGARELKYGAPGFKAVLNKIAESNKEF